MQKKRAGIMLALAVILVSTTQACAGSNAGGSGVGLPLTQQAPLSNATSNDLCNNSLYPVKQGATWMYASTGGPNGPFAYTATITELHADGFTLTSQFTDTTHTQAWACQPDGLKAMQIGDGTAAGISTQGMTAEFTVLEIYGLSLPKELSTGMQWQYGLKMQGTIAMPGDQQSEASGIYTVNMQEMGRETVTVPAGTFDAVKVQSNSTVDILTNFEGIEVPVKFSGVTISWYAPGVGYIKSVENGDFSGTTYSATTELQSYNTP